MAKTDIEDAFRIILIHLLDQPLLYFSFESEFYFDKCITMGFYNVSAIARYLNNLAWPYNRLCSQNTKAGNMFHILNDLLFLKSPKLHEMPR